jgi:fatty acid desaturase
MPPWMQAIRDVNNTLLGRLVLGPAIAITGFWLSEIQLAWAGNRKVRLAWQLHAAGVAIVLVWVIGVCGIGFWTYFFAIAYPGFSLLSVRTFVEHRAEHEYKHRTCVVEDGSGIFGLLFLNNNLHIVHHEMPTVPWYELPKLYREGKDRFLELNGGYTFPSYWAMARRYMLQSKGPVPHPFLGR